MQTSNHIPAEKHAPSGSDGGKNGKSLPAVPVLQQKTTTPPLMQAESTEGEQDALSETPVAQKGVGRYTLPAIQTKSILTKGTVVQLGKGDRGRTRPGTKPKKADPAKKQKALEAAALRAAAAVTARIGEYEAEATAKKAAHINSVFANTEIDDTAAARIVWGANYDALVVKYVNQYKDASGTPRSVSTSMASLVTDLAELKKIPDINATKSKFIIQANNNKAAAVAAVFAVNILPIVQTPDKLLYWQTQYDEAREVCAGVYIPTVYPPRSIAESLTELAAEFDRRVNVVRKRDHLPAAQAQWNAILDPAAAGDHSAAFRGLIDKGYVVVERNVFRWYNLKKQSEYGMSFGLTPSHGLTGNGQPVVAHLHCRKSDGYVRYASIKYAGEGESESNNLSVTGARTSVWGQTLTSTQMDTQYGSFFDGR